MSLTPWRQYHSQCLGTLLISAGKWSWVLLRVHEYSIEILNVQVLDSLINEKYWFLKWLPSSIFAISRSRYHQIKTNWIVLKSTQRGLVKMSKMELLGVLEAEKLKKQKCKQYCGTPCTWLIWVFYYCIRKCCLIVKF